MKVYLIPANKNRLLRNGYIEKKLPNANAIFT